MISKIHAKIYWISVVLLIGILVYLLTKFLFWGFKEIRWHGVGFLMGLIRILQIITENGSELGDYTEDMSISRLL